jgi:hypothetical protein
MISTLKFIVVKMAALTMMLPLTVKDDGVVQMSGYDLGELSEKFWHHEDYEYWVTAPATEVKKLLFALLKEKYLGRKNAAGEFSKFCAANGIESKWESWS